MHPRALVPLLLMAAMIVAAPRASAQAQAPGEEAKSPAPSQVAPAEPTDEADATAKPVRLAPTKLRLELQQVEDERAHSSDLLPWITVGVGAGAVLVSAIAGAAHTLSCDPGCDTPNWVAFAVVAGGVVGTLGAIWLIRTDAGLRELDSRRYQLQEELHQYELSRVRRDPTLARNTGTFSLRFAF